MTERTNDADGAVAEHGEQVKRTGTGPSRDENSGLHDIRALARSTKMRISQNMSAVSDDHGSLLASSSLALRAVALPEPGKDFELGAGGESRGSAAGAARSPLSPWLYAGLGAAVAATVVFLVLRSGKPDPTLARDTAPAAPAIAQADPGAGALQPATAGRALPGTAGAAREAEAAMAAGEPAEPEAGAEGRALVPGQNAPDKEAEAERPAASKIATGRNPEPPARSAAAASADPAKDKAKGDDGKAAKVAASKDRAEAATAPETGSAPGSEPADKSKEPAATKAGEHSLDSLLAEASGGAAGGDSGQPASAESKPAPTRTKLGSSDVQKAMAAVRGQAKACYDKFQVPGQVMVRFSVEPSGDVASAAATGSFKDTDTGNCVADAVKQAKFPAYDGAPMSFTYPFLLTQ